MKAFFIDRAYKGNLPCFVKKRKIMEVFPYSDDVGSYEAKWIAFLKVSTNHDTMSNFLSICLQLFLQTVKHVLSQSTLT